jgi:hypothetical protein
MRTYISVSDKLESTEDVCKKIGIKYFFIIHQGVIQGNLYEYKGQLHKHENGIPYKKGLRNAFRHFWDEDLRVNMQKYLLEQL